MNGIEWNFDASGNHKVIFSGDGNQTVSFASSDSIFDSYFANVDFKCGSIHLATPVHLGKEHKMNFDLEVYPEKGVGLSNNTWNLNGHTLTIHGKDGVYESSGGDINSASGKLIIDQYPEKGVGLSNNTWNLNGHTLTIHGKDGVYESSGGDINSASGKLIIDQDLVLKGNSITGGNITVNGNVKLQTYSINLQGNKMEVKGHLIQESGYMAVDGGTLEVGGDYRIQTQNPDGSYGESSGVLVMTNSADYVLVRGNFVTQSTESHYGNLTNGTMELKGDFSQMNGADRNFDASGNHKVILSGKEGQSAVFATEGSRFNILEIANLRSTYLFVPEPCWNKLIERVIKGDLNGNGTVDLMDARKANNILEIANLRSTYLFVPEPCWNKLIERVIKGDLNGNGTVDLMDARKAKRAAMKAAALTPDEIKLVDLNGDGKVDIMEARKIKRAAMKEIVLN